MRKKILTIAVLAGVFCSFLPAKTYAIVNKEELTSEDLKPVLSMFHNASSFEDLSENEKIMVLDQSIERKLIVEDAKKRKLQDNKEFKKIVSDFKKRLLIEFWMREKMNAIKVDEKDLKDYFEKHRQDYPKDAKIENIKTKLKKAVKMQKFQILVDETLSEMKKKAKIDFKSGVKVNYK